jgi:LPXTG-site transpeptidase (sortase) family protein
MRAAASLIRSVRCLPRWLIAIGIVTIVACAGVGWVLAANDDSDATGSNEAVVAPTETASPTPTADIEQLIIPAIKLDAPVTAKPVDVDGQMPSPETPQQVIWYDFSALPGLGGRPGSGNTVLAGHVDYHDYGPAVFANLRDVRPGDEITLRLSDGSEYKYQTQSNRVVDPNVASFNEIVASTSDESLTVITCAGDFDSSTHSYDMRRVVWAVRVG